GLAGGVIGPFLFGRNILHCGESRTHFVDVRLGALPCWAKARLLLRVAVGGLQTARRRFFSAALRFSARVGECPNQLLLAHRVPTRYSLLFRHLGEILARVGAERR